MAAGLEKLLLPEWFVGAGLCPARNIMQKRRAGYPKDTRSASLHSVEPRPYTPNIELHSLAFQSKSGSEKRSRDNAIFR